MAKHGAKFADGAVLFFVLTVKTHLGQALTLNASSLLIYARQHQINYKLMSTSKSFDANHLNY